MHVENSSTDQQRPLFQDTRTPMYHLLNSPVEFPCQAQGAKRIGNKIAEFASSNIIDTYILGYLHFIILYVVQFRSLRVRELFYSRTIAARTDDDTLGLLYLLPQ